MLEIMYLMRSLHLISLPNILCNSTNLHISYEFEINSSQVTKAAHHVFFSSGHVRLWIVDICICL